MLYLALPIVMQELVNSLVNILDTFMAGRVGLQELTAVGLANQIFFLFSLLCFGINSGSSIFMGQFWGKKDIPGIHKTIGICLSISLMAAALFAAAAFFIPETLMNIYSKNDTLVINYGAQYLQIICLSYFPYAITSSINASLKSCGQTRLPVLTSLLSLIMNCIFKYIFTFKLRLSVQGIALATVIARFIELFAQLILIYKLRMPVAGNLKAYMSADCIYLKKYLRIAVPVIFTGFLWAVGTSFCNIAFKYTGTQGQGAYQMVNTIQQLFLIMGISIGSACGILMARYLGAGELDRAIRYSRKCLVLSVVLGALMSGLLIIMSPHLVNIFNVSQEVKNLALKTLKVIAVCLILTAFNYTAIVGILRSGGDTLFGLLVDGLTVWLVGVPIAFVTAKFIGLPIYWVIAFIRMEDTVKFILSFHRVLRNDWARSIV